MKSIALYAALIASAGALVAPRAAPLKCSALHHHKVHRTPDENLEFYKAMRSWESEGNELDDIVPEEPKPNAFVPKTTTYADTRTENAVDLPVPAAFGGLVAAIVAGSAATGDPALALFAMPFAAGAVVFATNELPGVPVVFAGAATEGTFEREATMIMKQVRADVGKTRYFEGVHLYKALQDWSLAGMGSDAPVLKRLEVSEAADGACEMALVFESAEAPFRLWSALARGGKLEKFFGAPAAVTKVSQEDRLVAVTLRSRELVVEEPAEHSHSHSHAHAEEPEEAAAPAPAEASKVAV